MSVGRTGDIMAETREITIVIDREADDELTAIAEAIGRDKAILAREALLEWLEDQEDIRAAEEVVALNEPTIPLEEVKRILGLAS
jgi:predicted DNA-binding protein